jgi:hypothetical protein
MVLRDAALPSAESIMLTDGHSIFLIYCLNYLLFDFSINSITCIEPRRDAVVYVGVTEITSSLQS